MLNITDLPTELVEEIGFHTQPIDRRALRLTCNTLALALRGSVLASISLYIGDDTIRRNVEKLETLFASKKCISLHAIKELKISYRNNTSGPVSQPCNWDLGILETIERLLGPVILSLRKVSRVKWKLATTPDWAAETIASSLIALPLLDSFTVDFSRSGRNTAQIVTVLSKLPHCVSPPQHWSILLPQMCHAETQYLAVPFRHAIITPEHIKDVIRSSPKLKSLTLHVADRNIGLHQILQEHTTFLTELTFKGPFPTHIPSAFQLGPIAPRLTSLTINHHRSGYGAPTCDLTLRPQSLWTSLKETSGVLLTTISVSAISDSFLDFLSSYPNTLQELYIYNFNSRDGQESDRLARKFFEGALPKLKSTLIRLLLDATFSGEWCMTPENLKADFIGLINLQHLEVSINAQDLNLTPFGETVRDGKPNIVNAFLDSNILQTKFPKLEKVVIYGSSPEGYRNARGGTGLQRHADDTRRRLTELLQNYYQSRRAVPAEVMLLKDRLRPVLDIYLDILPVSSAKMWQLVQSLDGDLAVWKCEKVPQDKNGIDDLFGWL